MATANATDGTTNSGIVAVGYKASALSQNSIAIGELSTAYSAGSVAFGPVAQVLGTALSSTNAVAFGNHATVNVGSANALALGAGANVTGANSQAIGSNAVANGEGAISIGYKALAKADSALAIGANSSALGSGSFAFGVSSVAQGANSIAIGNTTSVTIDGATAIGNSAKVSVTGGIALGTLSNSNTLSGMGGYSPINATTAFKATVSSTVSTQGAVAVGDTTTGMRRQITGVAAGTTNTDAVNVAQLKALENTPMNFAGNSGSVAKILGNTLNIQGVGTTSGSYSGTNLQTVVDTNGVMQLQMADNPVVNSVIATDGTNTSTLAANGLTVTGGPSVTTAGINAAGKKVTNVAAGTISASSTDAVNGSQLNATNSQVATNTSNIATNTTNIANNTTNINALQDDALQWDATLNAYNANHLDNGPAKITNVAKGAVTADSTDAVNGSQLNATNNQVAINTGDITTLGDTLTTINNKGTKYFHANSTGTDSSATGVNAIAIGMGAVSDVARSIALGDGAKAAAAVGTAGATIGGQNYTFAGTAPVGTLSIGDIGAERTITNVAAGRLSATSTDAVNGSQLNATNQQVTANTTNIATNTTNIANNTASIDGLKDDALQWDATANGGIGAYSANHLGNGPAKITNVAKGAVNADSTDAVNGSQLNETNQQVATNTGDITTLGDTLTTINNKGTKYFHANSTGTDSVASGIDAVAIGMGAIASIDGGVALGAGSVADGSTLSHQAYLVGGTAQGEVNVGDRRITGLSAGADAMDAVNVA